LDKSPRYVRQEQVQELLDKVHNGIGTLEALDAADLKTAFSTLEKIFPTVAEATSICEDVLDTHLIGGMDISGLMLLEALEEMWRNVIEVSEYPAERGAHLATIQLSLIAGWLA
jgi:hypothetical protein